MGGCEERQIYEGLNAFLGCPALKPVRDEYGCHRGAVAALFGSLVSI